VFDGRREDEAGDGIAVGEKCFDEGFEVGEVGGGDLEEKIVAAGEVMTLADFFKSLHVVDEAMVILAGAAHADEGEDFEAEALAIDVNGVVTQDSNFFHLLKAFAGSGGREANAAGEFCQAKAGVGLKLMEELSSMNVEESR